MFIQCRGIAGGKNLLANKQRYKYDAIEYYEIDIDWLSFQFVPFIAYFYFFIEGVFVMGMGFNVNVQIILALMTQRSLQFILMCKIRDQKQNVQ